MKRSLAVSSVVLCLCFVGVSYGTAYAQFGGALGKLKKAADEIKAKKPETKPEEKPADTPKSEDAKPADKAEAPAAANASAGEPSKTDAAGQPVMTAVKIDYVPGEKTVFYDDFSDMAPDEPPPHWKVRGGVVSLKIGNGAHVLAPGEGVTMSSGSIAVPKDFTFEVVCNCKGEIEWKLENAKNDDVLSGHFQVSGASVNTAVEAPGQPQLGSGEIKLQPDQPVKFALWAQQGRVRAYLNGERIVDANQINFAGVDHIILYPSRYRPTDIVSVRLAESTPDFSTTLASSGKYVSHGIHFATDSDRLEPDSAPVLKMIAGGLIKNPNLKLAINGYTDSTGDAAHNLDLSKRRAAAVRQVLISQFGIDQTRLTAEGFGPQSPIGSNDTPDGRADNRRVEFVKQ